MIDYLTSHHTYTELRTILYPLGFLSSIAFTARFLVQWYLSEKAGASVVPKAFWKLSITGYCLLFIHSFIQGQFPMYLLQSLHLVLGWRNLNLMGPHPKRFYMVLIFLFLSASGATALYMSQELFLPEGAFVWVRSPKNLSIPTWVHVMGTIGVFAFALRFWVQWVFSELAKKSSLDTAFWYISLFGAILSSAYFITIQDWVNMIGPITGIIPYIRNLVLIQRKKRGVEQYEP